MDQLREKFIAKKKELIIAGAIFGSVFLFTGVTFVAAETFHRGRIFHGVYIGRNVNLSGLTVEEARQRLQAMEEDWWSKELTYQAVNESGKVLTTVDFYPIIVREGTGESHEFISYDTEAMLQAAYDTGRSDHIILRLLNQIRLLQDPVSIQTSYRIDKEQLREVLALELQEFETEPQNASFEFAHASAQPIVVSDQAGNTFDYDQAIAQTDESVSFMEHRVIQVRRKHTAPEVTAADANQALALLDQVKERFPVQIVYNDERVGFERSWELTWSEAFPGLEIQKNGSDLLLALVENQIPSFWERVESLVNVEPLDAKFAIDDQHRVQQFQPSQLGKTVDRQASLVNINTYLQNPSTPVATASVLLAVHTIEPTIKTEEVNDLGITEVLGTGYSNFSGSPRNRIHNIGIGADKLHGLLIAPDEEFSLLNALKPFTYAAGYLPELVIKGDKIVPEIGGGLCQIGSTTFRAAMNSGLAITQRRNHSLVVSYYNDPRNGNPGTDATIYDPAPDFRFKNDTGNYILIQTDMNANNGDLVFTFWGTSDGRKGEYSEPVVHRWIAAGKTKEIESTDLEPGARNCQSAHPGATASFVYTVTKSTGEVEEREFVSQYRPLPKICLVGVDPEVEKEEGQDQEQESGSGQESSPVEE